MHERDLYFYLKIDTVNHLTLTKEFIMTDQEMQQKANEAALTFIEEVVATETVHILLIEGNCIQTDSTEFIDEKDEPLVAVPVWSKNHIEEGKSWAGEDASIEEMPLAYFLNDFLTQLEEVHCTVGLNWDKDGAGRELTPFDMANLLVRKIEGQAIELPPQEESI